MFRVFSKSTDGIADNSNPDLNVADAKRLRDLCRVEEWTADMDTGMLQLGEYAAHIHNLNIERCGLINLIRAYNYSDQGKILEIFEQATETNSMFSFASLTSNKIGKSYPVFCIGESDLSSDQGSKISGVFIFPNTFE